MPKPLLSALLLSLVLVTFFSFHISPSQTNQSAALSQADKQVLVTQLTNQIIVILKALIVELQKQIIALLQGRGVAVTVPVTGGSGGGGGGGGGGGSVTPPSTDTTVPTVSLLTPTSGTTISGIINVTASALDNISVAGVTFKLDGTDISVEDTIPAYGVTLDTTGYSNGTHTISATARDSSNLTNTSSVTVTISNPVTDTTPPTISITSPTNNQTISGTINFTASASDNAGIAGVTFKVDGVTQGVEDTTAAYGISLITNSLTNGTHTLTATARDTSGLTTTSTITVTVSNVVQDTTFPTVSITNPINGTSVSGTINVTANASDNIGVVGVQFRLDGVSYGAEDQTAAYGISLDTTTLVNGSTHVISAITRDAAGNTTTSSNVTVTVSNSVQDTTFPTVSMTAPTNGLTVSGTINVTANASDNIAVQSVQFRLDGANLGSPDTISAYGVSWDTTTASNGSHTLTAIATDTSNNQTTATSVTVTVNNVPSDVTPPTVSLTAPTGGSTVSGTTVIVSATASDNIGVVGVQFLLDGNTLNAEDTSSPYSITWNTSGVTNGTHTLSARARDAQGNTATSAGVSVTVNNVVQDTTFPTVSVTSPTNGLTVSGTITVTASASDNVGVVGVQFQVNGLDVGTEDLTSPYTYVFDTNLAANGPITISARARDAAGNPTTSTAVSVTVNNNTTTSANVSVTVNNGASDTQAPTVPTNLAATAVSSSQINLTWTASTDNLAVAGYRIYRGGVQVNTSATNSYSDTGLTASTAYTYTVAAYDAVPNVSAQSSGASATTQAWRRWLCPPRLLFRLVYSPWYK
jgi:hypothetical protein